MEIVRLVLFNVYWLMTAKFGLSSSVYYLLAGSIILFLSEYRKSDPKTRRALVSIVLIGSTFDFLSQKIGLVSFHGGSIFAFPLWLLTLWFLFAWITPQLVFKFKDRRFVFCLASGIFGPLSYFWGIGFEILNIQTYLFYVVYGLFWSAFMYLILQFLYPKELKNGN